MTKETTENKRRKNELIIAALVLVAFLSLAFLVSTLYNTDRFYGNIQVAGVSVKGMTRDEARKQIKKNIAAYGGVEFGKGKLKPEEAGVNFDVERTLDEAFAYGRNPNVFLGIKERLISDLKVKDFPLETKEGKVFQDFLSHETDDVNVKVGQASVTWQNGLQYHPGTPGRRLLITDTKMAILSNFSELRDGQSLKTEDIQPQFSLDPSEVATLEKKVELPINLSYGDKTWQITPQEMTGWIKLEKADNGSAIHDSLWPDKAGGLTKISINPTDVQYYVSKLSSQVDVPVRNALLNIQDGRAVAFSPSVKGKELDQTETVKEIMGAMNSEDRDISLKVKETEPAITENNINDLGITELVAVGTSNFSGSPANRIQNIRNGASKFNGVIIKPGEEFSFNKLLGPVDASTGYAPELVILKDKTVPEYGGGLCQVSSTAFRAALNAGFPILERSTHAYPVTYYYPIGTDATIYLPKPDFRFKNDSSGHLLIQTSVVGNTLKFEFYGTKVNRTVRFANNADGNNPVDRIENIQPYLYNQGKRGRGSVDSLWYRLIYVDGKLTKTDKFVSQYDSPDKFPH